MNTIKDRWDKFNILAALLQSVAALVTAWVAISAVKTTNDIFYKVVGLQERTENIEKLLQQNAVLKITQKINEDPTSPDELKKIFDSVGKSIEVESQKLELVDRPVWDTSGISDQDFTSLSNKLNDAKSKDDRRDTLEEFFNKRK